MLELLARFDDGAPSLWVVSSPVAQVTRLFSCSARRLGVRVGDEVVVMLHNGAECRHNVVAVTDKECCLSHPYYSYIPISCQPKRRDDHLHDVRRREKVKGRKFYALRCRDEGMTYADIGQLMGVTTERARQLYTAAKKLRKHPFKCTTDVYADYLQQLKDADLLP